MFFFIYTQDSHLENTSVPPVEMGVCGIAPPHPPLNYLCHQSEAASGRCPVKTCRTLDHCP